MKAVKFLITIFSLIVAMACEQDVNCGSINVDYVTFQLVTVNEDGNEVARKVIFDSIVSPQASVTFGPDSAIALSSFALPLSPAERRTDYYFYYENTVDSIGFSYDKISTVDSPECGIDEAFINLDTLYQTYDSLRIENDTLNRIINEANIKLYL